MAINDEKLARLHQWMVDGAPGTLGSAAIFSEICKRVSLAGIPLVRARLSVNTLHPNLFAQTLSWTQEAGARQIGIPYAARQSAIYQNSPIKAILETGEPIYRHLEDPDCPMDFGVLADLAADAMTGYFAAPLYFMDGQMHFISWVTGVPGGFSSEMLQALRSLESPLARLSEIHTTHLNAITILNTYVGKLSGRQVLAGHIARGDTQAISAVILFADLKDFTYLSNQHSPESMIAWLNLFFQALGDEIDKRGGEILKLLGDGILAVFPISDEKPLHCQARCALDAVRCGRENLTAINLEKTTEQPWLAFRAAMHAGDIHYGNIGSENRLDFTAIGPTVNFTSRLLSAAPEFSLDLAVSHAIARALPDEFQKVGETQMKGFAGRQAVYGYAQAPGNKR